MLAAISYQESKWDNEAVSPTGVKGLMMLTKNTAEMLKVDRLIPSESIDGSAKYLVSLRSKYEDYTDATRLNLMLASYNVGSGHVDDVVSLLNKDNIDINIWDNLRKYLLKLNQKKFYKKMQYGYARGWEAVQYIENVKQYYDIISFLEEKDKKINAVSILPRIELSAQYGYNQTESNTSIILDQTSIGLTGFLNFSWDIFDGLAKNKITQNTRIQIESNKLELQSIKQEIQKEFNASYKQYENSINLIDIEKRNQSTSEKFFERAKEQFYQGQLSRNDFRLAQIDLSTSKNLLNQTLYNAKIAELNLYRLSGKIIEETIK